MQRMELFQCCKNGRFLHFYSVSRNLERILKSTETDEVRFDVFNVNSFFLGTSWARAVQNSLMPQNRSSSMESAHANAEAGVSVHRLGSGGMSIDFVG